MNKIAALLFFMISTPLWPYDCYLTGVVGPCWKDFDVIINVVDNSTNKLLAKLSIPKGKIWTRQKITCTASQGFLYTASFEPKIWNENPKSTYPAIAIYNTPPTFKKNTTAFIVPICFPQDFAEVPLPPTATTMCDCSEVINSVPPLPGELKQR